VVGGDAGVSLLELHAESARRSRNETRLGRTTVVSIDFMKNYL
jgi:hypothetical protein